MHSLTTTAFVSSSAAIVDNNMNLWSSIRTVISSLSSVTKSPTILTDVVVSTPPMAYFLALIAAGFGVPISEDAMCILVGTSLNALQEKQTRNTVLLALYTGIVLSDFITFSIGRALRRGVLEPIRKRVLGNENITTTDDANNNDKTEGKQRRRKRDRVLAKISRAGDYVGFVTRLSVGMRGPMILFTGFSGTTTFAKFAVGTILGAFVSLPIQLWIGYRMSCAASTGSTVFNVNTVATLGLVVSLTTIIISCLPFLTTLSKLMMSKIRTFLVPNNYSKGTEISSLSTIHGNSTSADV
eukprot:CAMPEP_0197835612 /NCGR_PEP_ID=MMETSP1437-20131217/26393_1 /TAXON_ID=49252 ORGANISM="Eucampia antarctica, Strain CCMP1452" /NCGR_SAMPLE_ID=MMETSP1437 /ASSEMBLY_ACC=CAM_ASM_001096 /LENGTH=297 /DNA_ID=CAMNT_0043441193 /DNA_START=120 /DNA_END=1013 /DNA_ORIENTATION=+